MYCRIPMLLCMIALGDHAAQAQSFFQAMYGRTDDDAYDRANAIRQTADGGYVVAGDLCMLWSTCEPYLLKLTASGATSWTSVMGGSGVASFTDVVQSSDLGFASVGATRTSWFDAENSDMLFQRADATGNALVRMTYGGPTTDEVGHSLQQTTDGGYILSGVTEELGGGCKLVKTDTSGIQTWTRTYGLPVSTSSVRQTGDGGYVFTGTVNIPVGYRVMVAKVDSAEDLLWSKGYKSSGYEAVTAIALTADGGLILAGDTRQADTLVDFDVLLVKLDDAGNVQWAKTYDHGLDHASGVQQTSDGGYIIAGTTSGDKGVYFLRTNGGGDLFWAIAYGLSSAESSAAVIGTDDGGSAIVGHVQAFNQASAYLIKTDPLGNSGCDQSGANTIVLPIALQDTSFTPTVASGGASASITGPAGVGGSLTTLCTVPGINEPGTAGQVMVHPVPAHGSLVVERSSSAPARIMIQDAMGRSIREGSIAGTTAPLDLSGLRPGLYILEVELDGARCHRRFLVD